MRLRTSWYPTGGDGTVETIMGAGNVDAAGMAGVTDLAGAAGVAGDAIHGFIGIGFLEAAAFACWAL